MCKGLTSDELQIARCQIRSAFKNGNNATIAKAFVCTIFIEVEPAFLLVIEEVEVLLGKFLFDNLLIFSSSESGSAIYVKAFSINYYGVFI